MSIRTTFRDPGVWDALEGKILENIESQRDVLEKGRWNQEQALRTVGFIAGLRWVIETALVMRQQHEEFLDGDE